MIRKGKIHSKHWVVQVENDPFIWSMLAECSDQANPNTSIEGSCFVFFRSYPLGWQIAHR